MPGIGQRESAPGDRAAGIGRRDRAAWIGPRSITRATVAHRTTYNQPHSLVGPRGHGRNQGAREGPRANCGPERGIIIGQSPADTSKSETENRRGSFLPKVCAPDPCAENALWDTWQGIGPLLLPLASEFVLPLQGFRE